MLEIEGGAKKDGERVVLWIREEGSPSFTPPFGVRVDRERGNRE
jgi:hypothetical protein